MKNILLHTFFYLALINFIRAQGSNIKVDSVYSNVFENVSVYKNFHEVYLGNYGVAKYSLISPFSDNSSDLYPFFNDVNVNQGYTDLFFNSGSGKEGIISLKHEQNLGKLIKAKLSLTQTSSEGFYLQQKGSIGNLQVKITYTSKKKKYRFDLKSDFYKRKNQLNGGISDSAFNYYYNNDGLRLLYPTNLTNANLQKNKRELDFTHYYKLTSDSNSSLSLKQQLNYYTEKLTYSDDANDFYAYNYIDSLGSFDSLKLEFLTHNLYLNYQKNFLSYYVGISNSYADYKANSAFIPSMIHSVLVGGGYSKKKFNISTDFSYTFSGFLKGNLFSKNKINYTDSNLFFNSLNFHSEYAITTPALYNYLYFSNHLKWDNNLRFENKLALKFNATSEKSGFKIGGEFQARDNFVYYNDFALVSQTNVSFYQVNIAKHFKITRWLHFTPKLYYQKVVNNQYIDLPEILTQNRLYFQGKLFKKVLAFKIGVDVLYYTDFFSKAYNPSFDNFHTQNSTTVGSYPLVDVFAEFYSKNNLAFFIKVTHANYGLMGANYLASPTYRQQDRTINFGVKWRLYN